MIDTILLNAIGASPNTTLIIVHDYDIDRVNYMNGSQGKYKSIVEKDSQGNVMKTTTFKYQDATYPTLTTNIEVK